MDIQELKELIEATILDMMYTNSEVQDLVVEILKNNSDILSESVGKKTEPKEPGNPDLYDNLLLIAQGKIPKYNFEGKTVSAPNYGIGFKSGKKIQEWTNKAYSKLGGKWEEKSHVYNDKTGIPEDTMSFLSLLDNNGSSSGNVVRAMANNDNLLREHIKNTGNGKMMVLKENGDFDGDSNMDISELLLDTAKTTFQKFPASHEGTSNVSAPADAAAAIMAESTPEEVFGEASNSWASIAFKGLNIKD